MAITLYSLGDLEAGRDYTRRGVQIWRSGAVRFAPEEVDVPVSSSAFLFKGFPSGA